MNGLSNENVPRESFTTNHQERKYSNPPNDRLLFCDVRSDIQGADLNKIENVAVNMKNHYKVSLIKFIPRSQTMKRGTIAMISEENYVWFYESLNRHYCV